jgi:uncharacterized repeat protein (TIGR02543 family)
MKGGRIMNKAVQDTARLIFFAVLLLFAGCKDLFHDNESEKPKEYTVTFDAAGGSPASQTRTVRSGSSVGSMPSTPSRSGYVFNGWYTASDGEGNQFTAATIVTADITLYARWRLAIATYTGDNISFKTVYMSGGLTFPTEIDDSGTATVSTAYEIGETEVTYELWYAVRRWAEGKGYTFYDNPGREGSSPSSQNTPPSENKQEPVTMVSWFDAVVWLNALTEWVNEKTGSSLTLVYYYDSACTAVARTSSPSSNFVKENSSYNHASAYAKADANGFRLPTIDEWELAARWCGNATVNTISGYTNPYYTKGNSASGATEGYTNTTATGLVAWYSGNATKTHEVKRKAANGLGLYDMSGNVYEWCFDWYTAGSTRIMRGGGWGSFAYYLQAGSENYSGPGLWYDDSGIRLVRTAE